MGGRGRRGDSDSQPWSRGRGRGASAPRALVFGRGNEPPAGGGWGLTFTSAPGPPAPGSIHSQLECLREGPFLGARESGTLGVTSTYKLDRIEMQMDFLSI